MNIILSLGCIFGYIFELKISDLASRVVITGSSRSCLCCKDTKIKLCCNLNGHNKKKVRAPKNFYSMFKTGHDRWVQAFRREKKQSYIIGHLDGQRFQNPSLLPPLICCLCSDSCDPVLTQDLYVLVEMSRRTCYPFLMLRALFGKGRKYTK